MFYILFLNLSNRTLWFISSKASPNKEKQYPFSFLTSVFQVCSCGVLAAALLTWKCLLHVTSDSRVYVVSRKRESSFVLWWPILWTGAILLSSRLGLYNDIIGFTIDFCLFLIRKILENLLGPSAEISLSSSIAIIVSFCVTSISVTSFSWNLLNF